MARIAGRHHWRAAQNCAPSLSASASANFFAPHCGTGGPDAGSTDVCPGDILQARVSIATLKQQPLDIAVGQVVRR